MSVLRSTRTWAFVLLLVATAWLGLSLQGMSTLVAGNVSANPGAVPTLVMSLSATIIGSAFLGSICAHLATGAPWRWLRPIPPLATGALAGLIAGVATGTVNYMVFAATPTIATMVAGTAGACALVGGLLASRKTGYTVFAGLTATLVLLILMFLRGWFDNSLLNLLTRTPNTYRWIGIAAGVIAGVCVGLAAYTVLRRINPDAKLYNHLGAGAFPGLLWLISEIGVRVAAAMLMSTTQEADQLSVFAMRHALDAQLNGCLAALFAGATTAVLAFGLLLPSHDDDADDTADSRTDDAAATTSETVTPTDEAGSNDAANDDSGGDENTDDGDTHDPASRETDDTDAPAGETEPGNDAADDKREHVDDTGSIKNSSR